MKRIVLADDSKTARAIVRRCLEIAGCGDATFVEAANGQEALVLLKEQRTDLFVTDLVMPDMDGREVLSRMAASPRLIAIPTIVVTSLANPGIDKELGAMESCIQIAKPVNPGIMAEALERVWGIWQRLGTDLVPGRFLEALDESIASTFEEMVFGEVQRCPEEEIPPAIEDWLWARVRIRVPAGASFMIACPPAMVSTFSALLHDLEESDVDEATRNDTLAEIANVAAGRCLTETLPAGTTYLLGVPSTGLGIPPDEEPPACVGWYKVNQTHPLRASFDVTDSP